MQTPLVDASPVATPAPVERVAARNHGLDALRVAAILGVVAIHVFGLIVGNDDLRGTLPWWIATAIDMGAVWCVPVFIMISGALVLAPRAHAAGPAHFYRKRFARILPALVFWHLVYLVLVRMMIQGERPGLGRLAINVIDGKVYTALYFLWLIAGLYVIAPVLAAFLKDGGDRRARITAGVAVFWTVVAYMIPGVTQLLNQSRGISLGAWNRWFPYVGFFLAGWALRNVLLSRRGIALAAVVALVLQAEVVWQYGIRPEYPWLQALLPVNASGLVTTIVSGLLFVIAVSLGARWTLSERAGDRLRKLSDATFGVFLVHLLVLRVVQLLVPEVGQGTSLGLTAGAYAVVVVVSFVLSHLAGKVPYLRTVV
ncbi:acyltransferase [Catellatospora aurea]|uniref:Acyltransferase n=1 Tax=Catellatospora aurea TaxID=1337874 RepID=A0ABW2GWN4_9ACTN